MNSTFAGRAGALGPGEFAYLQYTRQHLNTCVEISSTP